MKKLIQCAVTILTALMLTITVMAADLVTVIKAPHGEVHGGDTVTLDLYLHNPGDKSVTRELPLSLPCRIDLGQTSVTTHADLVGQAAMSQVSIPSGRFFKGNIPSQFLSMLKMWCGSNWK